MKNNFTYITEKNIHTLVRGPGKLRAFKVSTRAGGSPSSNGIPVLNCHVDARLSVPNASSNWLDTCAAGVNVATYDWCRKEYGSRLKNNGYVLWEVEFVSVDVACVPKQFDGKFRLNFCKVIRKITRKPKGLMPHAQRKSNG